jgi:hypothetical protein
LFSGNQNFYIKLENVLVIKILIFLFYIIGASLLWYNKIYKIQKSEFGGRNILLKALRWCDENIEINEEMKSIPKLRVHSHPNGNILGTYNAYTKTITIYVNRHTSFKSIIDTLIHEYTHHCQLQEESTNLLYDQLSQETSYWDNHFEVEARKHSKKHRSACIKFLETKK